MKSAILAATTLAIAAPATAQTIPAEVATAAPVRAPLVARAPEPAKHRLHSPSAAELRVMDANRDATMAPLTGGYLGGVQVYPWNEGAIYQVFTAPGQVTDIALQSGENLGAVASGDTVRWVIGDTTSGGSGPGEVKRTHVLVKPFTAGLSTNLVITTDRRTYHLALTSTQHTAMSALSWTYPADELLALKAAAEAAHAAQPVASGLSIEQLHFGYAISGDHPA